MLNYLIIILLTIIISYLGSVQLGPVNVMVIRYSLHKHFKDALLLAVGGSLPEIIWSLIAIKGNEFISVYPDVLGIILKVSAPLFFIIGIYFFFKKDKPIPEKTIRKIYKNPLLLGFSLALFNPLLLPFWIIVLNTYQSYNIYIENASHIVLFIISTSIGAFLLLYSLIKLIEKYHEKFGEYFQKISNPITGILFIVIALIQALQLFK